MFNPNVKASDEIVVVGVINPTSQGAGALSTGWIDMQKYPQLLAVLAVGVLGASATCDAKLEQANTSGGGGVKDITGKAITQLTKAGSDDNKQVMINLQDQELDINAGFRWARLTVTVAVAASLTQAIVYAHGARFGPEAQATTVDEIKA